MMSGDVFKSAPWALLQDKQVYVTGGVWGQYDEEETA